MDRIKITRSFGVLNRIYQNYISEELTNKDISYSDSIFLVNIGSNPGISQEELAGMLAVDKAAVARSVKNLENKSLVIIERTSADRRLKKLRLSDKGIAVLDFLQDLNKRWMDEVMKDLNKSELDLFAKIIEHVSSNAKIFSKTL